MVACEASSTFQLLVDTTKGGRMGGEQTEVLLLETLVIMAINLPPP